MVRDKVVFKTADLDFWKVGVEWNPIDFHSHVHKKHVKLGEELYWTCQEIQDMRACRKLAPPLRQEVKQ